MKSRLLWLALLVTAVILTTGCTVSPTDGGESSSDASVSPPWDGVTYDDDDPTFTYTMNTGTVSFTAEVVQTTRAGDRAKTVTNLTSDPDTSSTTISVDPSDQNQKMFGIGGSFTESSAYVLNFLSPSERQSVIDAYFSTNTNGAAYSVTRTPMAACDFSVYGKWSYCDTPGDTSLSTFSLGRDRDFIVPLIWAAQRTEGAKFKIMATPWTGPLWMKTGGSYSSGGWYGGDLLVQHYQTFANYHKKYLDSMNALGIPIWAVTPVNEPGGNGKSFESMTMGASAERDLVDNYLAPTLKGAYPDLKIFGFDHNRDGLALTTNVVRRISNDIVGGVTNKITNWFTNYGGWAYGLFETNNNNTVDGIAIHWYSSTTNTYNVSLDYIRDTYPDKYIMHTEGCIDDYHPVDTRPAKWGLSGSDGDCWQNDDWFWQQNATDWGVLWAGTAAEFALHPKYAAIYRYAVDIVETIQHGNSGWIDWNIVLDRNGGPNHVNNFCLAPVMIDTSSKEVYYTPMYYVFKQFARSIRPGGYNIGLSASLPAGVYATAVLNPDQGFMGKTVAVQIVNTTASPQVYKLTLWNNSVSYSAPADSIQTIIIRQN